MMASFSPICSLASGSVSIILLTVIWQKSPILFHSSPRHLAQSPNLFFFKIRSSLEFHGTQSLEIYSQSLPFPDSSSLLWDPLFHLFLMGAILRYCVLGPNSSLFYTPNQENIFYCPRFKYISVIMMPVSALAQISLPGSGPVWPTGPFTSSHRYSKVLQIHCNSLYPKLNS